MEKLELYKVARKHRSVQSVPPSRRHGDKRKERSRSLCRKKVNAEDY